MTPCLKPLDRFRLRYQHVIEGQDEAIVDFLERFSEPAVSASDHDDACRLGTQQARGSDGTGREAPETASDQDFLGGADGTRTHDPLLAKKRPGVVVTCADSRNRRSEVVERADRCCRITPNPVS